MPVIGGYKLDMTCVKLTMSCLVKLNLSGSPTLLFCFYYFGLSHILKNNSQDVIITFCLIGQLV